MVGGHSDGEAGRVTNIRGRELSETKRTIETHDSGKASVEAADRQEKVGTGLPIAHF